MSGLAPYRPGVDGPFDRAAAAHLYRRAGFGAGRELLDESVERGFEATLELLLAPVADERGLAAGFEALLSTGELSTLQAGWMARILGAGAPFVERVTLLWHDHFATSHAKVADARLMWRQNELFRRGGRASFRELLHAVAKDPAMLVWLDGDRNRRGQPNENFAREVMELFALGLGHYDERDVQEAARAFTGWGTKGRAFTFRPDHHDPDPKRLFGAREVRSGEDAIEAILDHPACARHIARLLLVELALPRPDAAEVEALAEVLVANDWRIDATLAHLFRSALFHSARARRARIAGPVELVALSVRALDARVAPLLAARAAADMGQALFVPPSVKGWDGGRAWIDAGSWIARVNALARLAAAHGAEDGALRVDLSRALGEPHGTNAIVAAALATLLPEGATPELRRALQDVADAAPGRERALVDVTTLILTSPEYQLV